MGKRNPHQVASRQEPGKVLLCYIAKLALMSKKLGNKMSEELIKNISLNFPQQEYEENLIILGKDGSLSVLNNTSKFLYENCDNQSVHTLTKRLIDACIEKDELNEKKVEMDVMNAIVQFEKKGFITFQNKY